METEVKSTHKVEVVKVKLEPHPNADKLSIVRVFGYSVCVQTAGWKDGDLGAYIVPDSIVDVRHSEFSFLRLKEDRHFERIRVKRLRGIISQGFLCPAPEGAKIGDDVAEHFGVTRYEPPESTISGGDAESPPAGHRSTYDVDAWHRFAHVFEEGEDVVVTEKLHGCFARFTWQDDRIWVGARNDWRKPVETGNKQNRYWAALYRHPWIENWCRAHPEYTLYGEIFGPGVQELHYGLTNLDFRVFDIFHDKDARWLDWEGDGDDIVQLCADDDELSKHWVPVLYRGPYNAKEIVELAEGKSKFADHVREGVVVGTAKERYNDEIGRVKLKIVGNDYLEK